MAQDELGARRPWQDRWSAMPVDLAAKTLLIVGFGRIGTRTAKRCLAMDMHVLVYDPYVPAATIKAAGCEPVSDLDAAVARADFISHPLPEEARDHRHVQRGALRADEADAPTSSTRRAAASSTRRRCTTRSAAARSRAPASTCSTRSRRRPTIRCSSGEHDRAALAGVTVSARPHGDRDREVSRCSTARRSRERDQSGSVRLRNDFVSRGSTARSRRRS